MNDCRFVIEVSLSSAQLSTCSQLLDAWPCMGGHLMPVAAVRVRQMMDSLFTTIGSNSVQITCSGTVSLIIITNRSSLTLQSWQTSECLPLVNTYKLDQQLVQLNHWQQLADDQQLVQLYLPITAIELGQQVTQPDILLSVLPWL